MLDYRYTITPLFNISFLDSGRPRSLFCLFVKSPQAEQIQWNNAPSWHVISLQIHHLHSLKTPLCLQDGFDRATRDYVFTP
jgi:hypothetical protein